MIKLSQNLFIKIAPINIILIYLVYYKVSEVLLYISDPRMKQSHIWNADSDGCHCSGRAQMVLGNRLQRTIDAVSVEMLFDHLQCKPYPKTFVI